MKTSIVTLMAKACCAAALLLPVVAATAQGADPAGDALGRCMVAKSTGEDRLLVARWFLGAVASAPQAADVATLKPGRKEQLDRGMAMLFTRLITVECRTQAAPLLASGSGRSFQVAGEALGKVAVEELFREPVAKEALSNYAKFLKPSDFTNMNAK